MPRIPPQGSTCRLRCISKLNSNNRCSLGALLSLQPRDVFYQGCRNLRHSARWVGHPVKSWRDFTALNVSLSISVHAYRPGQATRVLLEKARVSDRTASCRRSSRARDEGFIHALYSIASTLSEHDMTEQNGTVIFLHSSLYGSRLSANYGCSAILTAPPPQIFV